MPFRTHRAKLGIHDLLNNHAIDSFAYIFLVDALVVKQTLEGSGSLVEAGPNTIIWLVYLGFEWAGTYPLTVC